MKMVRVTREEAIRLVEILKDSEELGKFREMVAKKFKIKEELVER